MKKKTQSIQKQSGQAVPVPQEAPQDWIFRFWAWQALAWCLYRYFTMNAGIPETFEEFLIKPALFVVPVLLYILFKEHRTVESLGITKKNLTFSLVLGIGFGVLFAGEAMVANMLKFGGLYIDPESTGRMYGIPLIFLLSFATAFSEELLSRGFFFNRLYEVTKRLWYAAILSSLMFVAFHIPILLTTLRFTGTTLILFFLTNIVLGIANSLIFSKTRSLVAPILIHLFWNVTVAMFL
jgi:uncharacterized protein